MPSSIERNFMYSKKVRIMGGISLVLLITSLINSSFIEFSFFGLSNKLLSIFGYTASFIVFYYAYNSIEYED